MGKLTDTMRAARQAVERANAKDASDANRGVNLKPSDTQDHLARRAIKQNHTCDKNCPPRCEASIRI